MQSEDLMKNYFPVLYRVSHHIVITKPLRITNEEVKKLQI